MAMVRLVGQGTVKLKATAKSLFVHLESFFKDAHNSAMMSRRERKRQEIKTSHEYCTCICRSSNVSILLQNALTHDRRRNTFRQMFFVNPYTFAMYRCNRKVGLLKFGTS